MGAALRRADAAKACAHGSSSAFTDGIASSDGVGSAPEPVSAIPRSMDGSRGPRSWLWGGTAACSSSEGLRNGSAPAGEMALDVNTDDRPRAKVRKRARIAIEEDGWAAFTMRELQGQRA